MATTTSTETIILEPLSYEGQSIRSPVQAGVSGQSDFDPAADAIIAEVCFIAPFDLAYFEKAERGASVSGVRIGG
jgi:hypothetical protein